MPWGRGGERGVCMGVWGGVVVGGGSGGGGVYLWVCKRVCVGGAHVRMFANVCAFLVYMCVCVCLCLCVCVSVCLSVCLSVCVYVCASLQV